MFEIKLFSTQDNREWHEILNRCALKDVHYLPEYMALFENGINQDSFISFGGQGFLFVYGNSNNFIIYPFFKRSLSHMPFAIDSTMIMYDIISPYGYGGPLAQVEDATLNEELWRGFYLRFHEFCQENKIVSEFCRLHPIFENHIPTGALSQGTTELLGPIVYIDLSYPAEEIIANMIHGHRRHIQSISKNSDFSFCLNDQDDNPQNFFKIYTKTMQRLKANEKYFFSQSFFEAIFRTFGKSRSYLRITYKGETVSGWIILKYGNLAYCWLSGSNPEFLHFSSTHLLVYETILQLKKEGFKYMVLGGGRGTEKDSLFYFKAGFSRLTKDFYIYKKIHLYEEYEELVRLRGYMGENTKNFFPLYRLKEKATAAQLSSAEKG